MQSEDEYVRALIVFGTERGIRLHHFKEKEDLPKVRAVPGALHNIQPEELLDTGSINPTIAGKNGETEPENVFAFEPNGILTANKTVYQLSIIIL